MLWIFDIYERYGEVQQDIPGEHSLRSLTTHRGTPISFWRPKPEHIPIWDARMVGGAVLHTRPALVTLPSAQSHTSTQDRGCSQGHKSQDTSAGCFVKGSLLSWWSLSSWKAEPGIEAVR